MEALVQACARNSPVEIVQTDLAGVEPFARGRMLEIESGVIVLEEVQVIGKTAKFGKQTPLLGYFRFGSRLFEFRSRVMSSAKPVKLNRATLVPAMDILMPEEVEEGQRRNVFRIPLAALNPPIRVEFWYGSMPADGNYTLQRGQTKEGDGITCSFEGGETEDGTVLVPSRRADWLGTLIDASDVGLGINIENCRLSELKQFTDCYIRFQLPGDDDGPLTFRIETRQVRSIREGVIRVGCLIYEGKDRWSHAAKVRRLWSFLTQWQRKVVRIIDPTELGNA
ncbi:MAG: hypothetical protein ED559_10365 [Phycisphaera sp.]|nr:MAG: hypothetical protein ED559_10365 [Phycisphaera sp.]